MVTRLVLQAMILSLIGQFAGSAKACSNPINPSFLRSVIHTARFHREFIITGCADDIPPDGLPVVFGFHGGGEGLHEQNGKGFLDFTALPTLHALVIAPVGNESNNGHSWINAFPWMKSYPENDLDLPAALIDEVASQPDLPRTDVRRVYAVGKSDGAGMAMALACQRDPRVHLVGVALISGAYSACHPQAISGEQTIKSVCPSFPFA